MLKNYLKIAWRNIKRHKGFSFINIAGLAIGMACTILILTWIQDELSFDRFHEKGDRIYRVIVEDEQGFNSAGTCPIPLAPRLKERYPEVLESTRFCNGFQKFLVEYEERVFYEEIGIVDPSFFEIFTFPFREGDPGTAFNDPYSLVMTERMARKYFGTESPIGKTLQVLSSNKEKISFTVTGLLRNIPRNSHLKLDIFVPFKALDELVWWANNFEKWGDWSYFTYVLLQPGSSIPDVNTKITNLVKENYKQDEMTDKFTLQSLTRIHLYSNFKYDLAGHGDIRTIHIFAVVALFILLIACANFMNLSTARFAKRSKEVGLRKTVGAQRIQLIKHFFSESLFLVLLSLFVALVLVKLAQPVFNQLTGKQIEMDLANFWFILSLILVVVFTGLLSGSYPALFLSALQPADVLRGETKTSTKGGLFRKVLVVIQFSLSIIIIICTIAVFNQLNFLRHRKLGFDKDNILYMPLIGEFRAHYDLARNELLQNPSIIDVTASDQLFTQISRSSEGARLEGKEVCEHTGINFLTADFNLLETFNMTLSQGRPFSKELSTDAEEAVIINQTLAKTIGVEPLIRKKLYNYSEGQTRRIIGIVEDFHFESLHSKVRPLMIVPRSGSDFKFMYVRIGQDAVPDSINLLKNIWKKYGFKNPFEYHFLDQTIDQLYASEQRMGKIFLYFALLAIFISCLGLFVLVSFMAEQRTKEIGIRKVLGASVSGITRLLSREFIKWIIISNVFAWPVAYYAMYKWLQNFAYRTSLNLWIFLMSGALAFIIAVLTVSYQSIRAAVANPADSLRYE